MPLTLVMKSSGGGQYKRLSQQVEAEDLSTAPKSWWCPKLTRLKLASVTVISLCTIIFLSYKALSPILIHGSLGHETLRFDTPYTMTPLTTEAVFFNDRIRYKHTKRQLPWCIIIGVRKAGTRALLTFLDLHPQIRTARNEVHFFDQDDNFEMGLDWYRKKMPFSFSDQITIEKSPAYFVCDYVPKRVFEMNSTIKLLLIVRDPVPRTVSDYLQIHIKRMSLGKMHDTFENLVIDPNTGDIDPSYRPIQRSLYYRYMRRWLSWFSNDQIHIVDGDKMIQDPVTEIHKVETFLGLEHKVTTNLFYYNETRGFFCLRNETGQKCLAESKGRKHPFIDPNILSKLRAFFRPYNRRFYHMTNQQFDWD